MRTSRRVSVAGLLLATVMAGGCAGSGFDAGDYVFAMPSDTIDRYCLVLNENQNLVDAEEIARGHIEKRLRDEGEASESQISQRAEKIVSYLKNIECD